MPLKQPGTILRTHSADGVDSVAVYDSTEQYRYFLRRIWREGEPLVSFIGLNPSTATELQNDPTVQRCQNFANRWGYGGFIMLNIFAYRSTDPQGLKEIDDPVGLRTDEYLRLGVDAAERVVCCWGTHGQVQDRHSAVRELLANDELFCFRQTKAGFPNHPLYLRNDSEVIPYT